MRRRFCLIALFAAGVSTVVCGETLEGLWKGTLRRRHVYQTRFHQAVYDESLEVTLLVRGAEVAGHAALRFSDPLISRTHIDPSYAQWRALYPKDSLGVTVTGQRTDEGKWITLRFALASPYAVQYFWKDGTGARIQETLHSTLVQDQTIPWTEATLGQFVRQRPVSSADGAPLPVDLAQTQEPFLKADLVCDGGFQKVETPPLRVSKTVMLACLLIYLLIMGPLLVRQPSAASVLAMLGTLVGTLDALEGLGLWEWARMARLAGFSAAALLFFLENNRLRQVWIAQETLPSRYKRILLTMGICLLAFWMGLLGMGAWMQVSLTAGVSIGRLWATALAVTGALLWTLILAAAARQFHRWVWAGRLLEREGER